MANKPALYSLQIGYGKMQQVREKAGRLNHAAGGPLGQMPWSALSETVSAGQQSMHGTTKTRGANVYGSGETEGCDENK
ncbi:MAG: hypothetical protein ACK5JC_05800 [Bacteroidota bacterium]|jgi:hypothetical protein